MRAWYGDVPRDPLGLRLYVSEECRRSLPMYLSPPTQPNGLQSEAHYHACGCRQWVNYFLHSGHLGIDGLKMSKSLKNFITIRYWRLEVGSWGEHRVIWMEATGQLAQNPGCGPSTRGTQLAAWGQEMVDPHASSREGKGFPCHKDFIWGGLGSTLAARRDAAPPRESGDGPVPLGTSVAPLPLGRPLHP